MNLHVQHQSFHCFVLQILHFLEGLANGGDIGELLAAIEMHLQVLHVLHFLEALADG